MATDQKCKKCSKVNFRFRFFTSRVPIFLDEIPYSNSALQFVWNSTAKNINFLIYVHCVYIHFKLGHTTWPLRLLLLVRSAKNQQQ